VILVFGSINLDLVAQVARLPRPGETIAGRTLVTAPGGKGANQALAARRAGADVVLYGAVGRDAFAEPALALLREAGVDLRGVRIADAPTGVALIHVEDSGENAITVIPGANFSAVESDVPDAALGPKTTLLLQLEVRVDESLALATRAHRLGARVIMNAAPALPLDRAWIDVLDVLVVNEHEAAMLAHALRVPEEAGAFAAALGASRPLCVIVTMGARGALAVANGTRYGVPAHPVQCVDTVGAGDAFVGTLAAGLDGEAKLPRALARACVAGALACTRVGAQPSFVRAEALAAPSATLESRIDVSTLPPP
jgi:ribokinase